MIIKRLSASFGRLQNEMLELEEGLNIIQAPNESGKSTWCAFIKAMLYGIRTSDRDKVGYLSAKTRYRPWCGMPMEGSMDLETSGMAVTLQRTSGGKQPMKNFSAVLTGSGEQYPNLYPETVGETLTGASEEVFERSAYISQAGVKVNQTPELEKRISSLVSTGDETVSYTETDERLRQWLRKRRFNKSGSIPALEEKRTKITNKLDQIETALDDAAALRLEAERLKQRQDQLSEELRQCQRYESTRNQARAREEYERVRADYEKLYKELTKNGHVPSESELAEIRGELKALESLEMLRRTEQNRMTEARTAYESLFARKDASPFSGQDAASEMNSAAALEHDIQKYTVKHAVSLIILVLTIVFAVLAVLLPDYRLYAAALALIGALLLISRILRYRSLRGKLESLLNRCGVDSVIALNEHYQAFMALLTELVEVESTLKSAEKSVFSAAENCRSLHHSLAVKLETAGFYGDPEIAERELSRIELQMQQLATAKADTKAAESVLHALKESDVSETDESIQVPERNRKEISAELSFVTSRVEDITNQYNMALGAIRALGDPVILGSEKISTESAIEEQTAQYEAISLAVDTLKEANTELQSRFSPLLGETAGRIMSRLTDGRYEKLAFDKSLEASVQTKDETVSRNVLSLSVGTADQIYLALRLAVCEMILPEDKACPLILDDTLCNFDDQRAYLALDYLKTLARTRQILLFTCHAREADYFSGSQDVNKIIL